jgi:peptidoglycan/xylan/chitin deacetylase (PgdA/CDA1 family)
MVRPRLFRPPDVLWNADTARAAADTHTLGVLHTVETNDYLRPGAPAIVRAAERAKPGGVIALHDAGGDRSGTIAAIRPIVRSLARRGLRAVTVGDLIGYPPPSRFALSGAKGDAAAGPS